MKKEIFKSVMDLKYVKQSVFDGLSQANSYYEIRQILDKNLTQEEYNNELYVFRGDAYKNIPSNLVTVGFVVNTKQDFVFGTIGLTKTAKLSDFKNGYFIASYADGTKDFIVINFDDENCILTLNYDNEIKEMFDKVYENPLYIKEIADEIEEDEELEAFRAIAEWSFYQRRKAADQIFDGIEDSLERKNKTV